MSSYWFWWLLFISIISGNNNTELIYSLRIVLTVSAFYLFISSIKMVIKIKNNSDSIHIFQCKINMHQWVRDPLLYFLYFSLHGYMGSPIWISMRLLKFFGRYDWCKLKLEEYWNFKWQTDGRYEKYILKLSLDVLLMEY